MLYQTWTQEIARALDRAGASLLIPLASVVQMAACIGLALADSLPATYALVIALQLGFTVANPTWTSVLARAVGDDRIGQLVSAQQSLMAAASPVGAGNRGRAGASAWRCCRRSPGRLDVRRDRGRGVGHPCS